MKEERMERERKQEWMKWLGDLVKDKWKVFIKPKIQSPKLDFGELENVDQSH